MATIVVDTTSDAVADDSKTSLREALATAMDAVGHTDIIFSEAAFMAGNQVVTMSLTSTLTISKGDIAIDGSLFYGGPYSSVTISSAGLSANALTVEAGARVVRFGGLPFIVIVLPERPDYAQRARDGGALLMLDPQALAACLPGETRS